MDIGNLDLEYEWFLRKASDKVEIKKNSVIGRKADEEAGYQEYLSQVRERIRPQRGGLWQCGEEEQH